MEVTLLLTGCIKPNITNDMLAISDAETRKKQYIEAINWYLEHTPYNIVFCDNSLTDISDEFSNLYKNRLTIMTYMSSDKGSDRTKGYREMEILEYINEHTVLGGVIVKITGRLILLNIVKIVEHLQRRTKNTDFVSAYMYGRRKFCDSRFIFFSKKFFPILLAKKEQIYDWKHNFEFVTFEAVLEAKKQNLKFIYPSHVERVHGIGGGHGISYDCSDMKYLKLDIKHQLKRLLFYYGYLPRLKSIE